MESSKLLHPELTEPIIGVYYDVYNEIGHGFLESVYFRGRDVGKFKADLVVNSRVLVELKAVQCLDRSHEAQVMNYLRATALEVALLLNFGGSKPQFRRIVFENEKKKIRVHPRESAVSPL